MSESVTLLPLPKDIKIGVGAAFIKAHSGMLLWTAPNTNLIANDDLEEERGGREGEEEELAGAIAVDGGVAIGS